MPGRITFTQVNTVVQNNIRDNYSKLDTLQGQLSSGKRITRPSDAPVDITNVMELRSNSREIEQFKRNIDDGISYLSFVDTTLSGATELMQGARERALQASNDTYSDVERKFLLQEIRVILDQMVSLANSNLKGNFVFSGNNSQVPPYEIKQGKESIDATDNTGADSTDTFLTGATVGIPIQLWDRETKDSNTSNGNARAKYIVPETVEINGLTEGTDYEIDYLNGTITFLPPATTALTQASSTGIDIAYQWVRRNEYDFDGTINREMESGVVARLNTTATQIFGPHNGENHWKGFISLLEGLHENDSDLIRSSMGLIDTSLDRQLGAQAVNGSRMNRFEATQSRGDQRLINITDTKSKLEDLDFARTISEFLLQQSVYDASLRSGARVIQNSLVNFL